MGVSVSPERFGTGVFWSGATAAAGVVLPFCLFVYFAHTVGPAEIGLVAVAIALSESLKAVGLPGLYEALLQQKPVRRTAYETAMALLLCAGVVLALAYLIILFGLSCWMAGLRGHFPLLALISLRIPLDLASVQPQAALAERLAFRRLAMRTVVGNGLAGLLGAGVSRYASPIEGLVCYQVGQSVLTCMVTMLGADSVARPCFHRDELKSLAPEAGYATANRMIAAAINSFDQLILAAVAGNIVAAYYNVGKRLETTFVTVANSFTSVLFQPLFARSAGPELAQDVRRGLLTILITCGLPAAIIATNGRCVVDLLFGQQWRNASLVVSLLAVSGLARGIGMIPGSLLSVSGRNRELLTSSLASAVGSVVIVVCLGPVSLVACAGALAVKNAAVAAWLGMLTRHEAGSAFRRYTVEVLLPFLALVLSLASLRPLLANGMAGPAQQLFPILVSSVVAAICVAAFLLARRAWCTKAFYPAAETTGPGR